MSSDNRCEDLWFEDGNVVLRAEDTYFKVYEGILSRESPVFVDMFSLPHPPGASDDSFKGSSAEEDEDEGAAKA